MVSIDTFRKIALSFPGTEENPHFDRAAFKVTGRRIFATMQESSKTCNIVLTPSDQAVFCTYGKNTVYPVRNKWGLQGWTTFELEEVEEELISDALLTAYNDVIKSGKKKK